MREGEVVQDFELPADDGSRVKLSDELAQGPVVLFFYPKAMTPGCTAESCMFRDRASEFAEVGARRLGISLDSVEKQHQFSEKHGFDYPLLSDKGGAVAKQFGVKRPGLPLAKRATFVIGTDFRLLSVIQSEFNTDKHGEEALAVLRNAAAAGTPPSA